MKYIIAKFSIQKCFHISGPQGTLVVLLVEKKNKERGLVAHNIKRGGKTLELGEEFSAYDKVG